MHGLFPNGVITDETLRVLVSVAVSVFTVVLLVLPPLVWFNIRRLRIDLHADLSELRASLDRLSAPNAPSAEADTAQTADAEEAVEVSADGQIGFTCPECGKFFEGPGELAGTDFACPECGVRFHIH